MSETRCEACEPSLPMGAGTAYSERMAHHALLRSERERADRLAAALRSVLYRFRHSSEDGWHQDVRAALKEQEP